MLLDAAKQQDREHRKEISRAVKNFFDDPKFANVPPDFLSVAKDAMKAKAVFDPKSQLLVIGKKKLRDPAKWLGKKFPSLLKQADAPRGDVELQAAQTACQSLSMQADLVKAMGVERTGELMALYGGAVGKISKPLPIEKEKEKQKIRGANNPWSEAGWSLTKQGQICRELGEEAARGICKSAGVAWGATKPAKAAI
jgi:hypothetical protein